MAGIRAIRSAVSWTRGLNAMVLIETNSVSHDRTIEPSRPRARGHYTSAELIWSP